MNKSDIEKRISNFLFEIGTMRKLPRMHQQTLLTQKNAPQTNVFWDAFSW